MSDEKIPAEWQDLIVEFQHRKSTAQAMGGQDKLSKRSNSGRLNARQLIELLVDKNSFMELGTLVGGMSYNGEATVAADALIGGLASINGRSVVIAAEDFTSKGGSIGHGTNAKRVRLARLAAQEKVPYILMLDGAGARVVTLWNATLMPPVT
ncbi:carboxyl transferase domain-containing protein [Oceanicoccus sp. KOV_DT_Chl]|uniref:carboxyl transferase domain-containing protein n=1 Tax=Oceanicoccus sp. KOV_DT_Chl TaxID=1904639 RepID=UPI00190F0751|nr:carboxyl transferase domain-containing protein [Oceanicoccus sp. KOV_DT_Chl]